jgi:hypothetical protein
MLQVVARDPVLAEDQLGAHVHVHRGHGQQFADRVAEAEMNQHLRDESQRCPSRRH